MRMSLNSVTIGGHLGHAPELRQTKGGTSVCNFSICANDRRKNSQTGEWEDYPVWVDVTFFGGRADFLAKTLEKGSHVVVLGKLTQSRWEKDGKKLSKLSVIGNDIELDRHSGSDSHDDVGDVEDASDAYEGNVYDDDIPF